MGIEKIIRKRLATLQPRELRDGFQRESAVLMPVFEEGGTSHFLLTRRTEGVKTHKGQISFPGGMRLGNESLEQTALRETHEEVGIPGDRIEVLGRYHDYLSITRYRVAPFAGFVRQPFPAIPQKAEVAEIIRVPFEVFTDPSRLRVERQKRLGVMMDVYFYRYGRYDIWGLTARIIKDFLEELRLTETS